MKKILGLDVGTASIGWAVVHEYEEENTQDRIEKIGTRIIPITTDEQSNFEQGESFSVTQERTANRGARRNLQRYKLRREKLLEELLKHNMINTNSVLVEDGKNTTYQLWELRSRSVTDKISLNDFSRVLLAINKKRGYKSNRKAKGEEDGQAIDGMSVAIELYEKNLTPGQYVANYLSQENKYVPDFYPSDLQSEFDQIWNFQKQFYVDQFTNDLKESLLDKNKAQTWAILKEPLGLKGFSLVDHQGKKIRGFAEKCEIYRLRSVALSEFIEPEKLAIVLQQINNQKKGTSGYLGAVSDRSKELYFNKQTIGQSSYAKLRANPHAKLRGKAFYRQDYLDEFEQIWEKQKMHYPEILTDNFKKDIRDIVIFYQRPLRSQKGLISICELEGKMMTLRQKGTQKEIIDEKTGKPLRKLLGPKVISKSNPLFQEFKIWQTLNNLEIRHKNDKRKITIHELDGDLELRNALAAELDVKAKLTSNQVLKILAKKPLDWELNFKDGIQGNITNDEFYKCYKQIIELTDQSVSFNKDAGTLKSQLSSAFENLGIESGILSFNHELDKQDIEMQPLWQLWHLLYSYAGDNSNTGNDSLYKKLKTKFGFIEQHAKILATVRFKDDYGSLSARAIRKILPYLKSGHRYSDSCELAGYRHSNWTTAEENLDRPLKDKIDMLPKNSLRNPVVEKILNQTAHVVNAVIEKYGKPDEVRIELARELKKSAKERKKATKGINDATKAHDQIRSEIAELPQFSGGVRITRNDIIRYKLWQELQNNGYKTLYSNTYVSKEEIFSRKFDIEHIIPKAIRFDDSFSNKTLELRDVNQKKSSQTAYDFISDKPMNILMDLTDYEMAVNNLYKNQHITKAKRNKLLMKAGEIGDEFIERDLRNSQYIAKKAQEMLREVIRVVTPTTGSITDRLRQDWQLINVLKEINLPTYEKLGLTHTEKTKDGRKIKQITDWTKRNDQRHHAMDALTIAFTKPAFIQYLNYLNARRDVTHKKHSSIVAIEQKYTYFDENKKRLLKPPMPLDELREAFKKHLNEVLVSYKAKNKVVTKNINRSKQGKGRNRQNTKTPRGQLHKASVYGQSWYDLSKMEKVSTKFDGNKILMVADRRHREALEKRLAEFQNDPKKAFGGKNAPSKSPIYLDASQREILPAKVKLTWQEKGFTIRKKITPKLKIDKITDEKIRDILKQRLDSYAGDAKKAFINLEENPIWQNEEKGIAIKRVTITGVSEARPLHYQQDHHGKLILDEMGNPIPKDYIQTGNNHHVAIYSDANGNLHEQCISFFDAVERVTNNLPIVNKNYNQSEGWEFLYSMKQNEMFVFPDASTGFNPHEIDLLDPSYLTEISNNLFRVQKFGSLDYTFRHHLETVVQRKTNKNKEVDEKPLKDTLEKPLKDPLKDIIWKRICSMKGLQEANPVKVRINHIGEIVHIGEC